MALRDTLNNFAQTLHLPKPPFWMVSAALLLVVLTWVPLALIARARVTTSPQPRIHLFQGMDEQPRFGAQEWTPLFQDHRTMRPPVPGTVARGQLRADDHYERGFRVLPEGGEEGGPAVEYFDSLPAQVKVDEALLLRGQTSWNVYCSPCHGLDGQGNGAVNQRALQLMEATGGRGMGTSWVTATNLLQIDTNTNALQFGPDVYPDGKLYSVITSGIRNMPAYGSMIEPQERWAIVAYIRALQLAQHAPVDVVPEDQRRLLR